MKLLAIETATRLQSVALLENERVVGRSDRDVGVSHAQWLVPTIDRLLAASSWCLKDLEGLAVSVGPGSFTGLRIGLATMMGLRLVTGIPLAAVPTLEGMAWNLRGSTRPICPMLKGRVGEVYWARYLWAGRGALEHLAEERVDSFERVADSMEGPTVVFGEGWQAYKRDLLVHLGPRARDVYEAPPESLAVSAVSVGLAGLQRLARGERAPLGIAPRYVQRSEAELNWERAVEGSQPRVKATRQRRSAARA